MNEPDIPEDLKRLIKHVSEERDRLGKPHVEAIEKRKKSVLQSPPKSQEPNVKKIPDIQQNQGAESAETNPQEHQDPT